MDILLGILVLLIGAALCLIGLRMFFVILPIAGLVAGFFAGAAFVSWLFGDGFLSTALGIVVGLVFAVIFALLSYLYWYIGVIISAAAAGGVIGSGIFAAFGVDSEWILWTFGIIGAVLFAFAAMVLNYPTYLVIFATSIMGAILVLGGFFLMFNQVDSDELIAQQSWEKINDNWWLWLVWIVIVAVGIAAQVASMAAVRLPEDKWVKAEPVVV
ncbi:MAG TPA: DUF4203 domain-containing protein [Thermomicrobiales bacterium]|nr:DUF4203 domain-containing protein [Thermomicrobiales bacterium]